MVIDARTSPSMPSAQATQNRAKTKITIFHCFTALNDASFLEEKSSEIESIKMPCSSMTREVFLLRAFESGADAVIVLVCPVGTCRYLQGNLRAAKRVTRVKKLLDEIGLDGRRLNLYHIPQGDQGAVKQIIEQVVSDLEKLGPSPAK